MFTQRQRRTADCVVARASRLVSKLLSALAPSASRIRLLHHIKVASLAMKRSRDALIGGLDNRELKDLIAEHSPYLQLTEEGRVRCTLNGHVMPARRDAIETLVK